MAQARTDGHRRREAILDAALRCFAERGLLHTGIEEIRKAAGASPSSIYHLFDGLPGITRSLLHRTFEGLFADLTQRVLAEQTAEGVVRALVTGQVEWVLGHPTEARFMYQAMSLELGNDETQALASAKVKLLAPIVGHLKTFAQRGELPPWTPLTFDVIVLGPTHEACRRHLGGADLSAKWMRTELPSLAWQTVCSALPPTDLARPKATTRRPAPSRRGA